MGRAKFAKYSQRAYDALVTKDANTIYAVNDTGDFSSSSLDTEGKLYIGEKPIKMDAIPFGIEYYDVKLDSTSGDIALMSNTEILSYQFYSSGVYMVMAHVTLRGSALTSVVLKKVIPNQPVRPDIISSTTVALDGYASVTLIGVLSITEEDILSKATMELCGSNNSTLYSGSISVEAIYENYDGANDATRMYLIKIA